MFCFARIGIWTLGLSLSTLGLTACNGTGGSGTEASDGRQVEGFDEVKAGGVLSVDITRGTEYSVTVSGDDNLVPLVDTSLQGEALVISTTETVRPELDLRVTIVTPELTSVSASGASKFRVQDIAEASLEVDASGASRVELTGEVDQLEINASGATKVRASGLQANAVEARASGAADVHVTVMDTLDGHASGAASIAYGGNPEQVQRETSGAGSVERE